MKQIRINELRELLKKMIIEQITHEKIYGQDETYWNMQKEIESYCDLIKSLDEV